MTYSNENIHKLTNIAECLKVKERLNQVLNVIFLKNNPWQLCLRKKKNWLAVPVAPKDNFRDLGNKVLNLRISGNDGKLWGVFIETIRDDFTAFEIQANIEGLLEFNTEPLSSYKVIFTGEPDWLFIMAESEYYVLLGSVSVVEEFLNCTADRAYEEFDEYIESWEFPEQYQEKLQPLKENFKKVSINLKSYQNLPVGNQINIFS